jgi:DNA modification methylase
MQMFPVDSITWDPAVYPRAKWATSTIERYAEALDAGSQFPPIVLEEGTNRLLDGKHRLEAYKKVGRTEIPIEWQRVPEGMSAKYYAATLSAAHGDRVSNADLKALAEEEFEANPSLSAAEWGRRLGVPERTVRRWVSHITERWRRSREAKAWRLAQLGWTQVEIGERLGADQSVVSRDMRNGHLAEMHTLLGPDWNEKSVAHQAERLELPLVDAWAAALDGLSDQERLARLGIKLQPYDVWNFPRCHDLMGDNHPGRIPGELVCHALYFFTQQGDLVADPMAGSGTTLDACLLMGRKARGYDIDLRHERIDIMQHDLSNGWPEAVAKAALVFWDPPYFDKMDRSTIGQDGYIEGSISGKEPEEYLNWFGERFVQLRQAMRPGAKLAFLMSDWDPENAKAHAGHPGIFLWDYADLLRKAGWRLVRQIQVPLSTQQVHPDIVNKFRASRRLARLGRYLMVAER